MRSRGVVLPTTAVAALLRSVANQLLGDFDNADANVGLHELGQTPYMMNEDPNMTLVESPYKEF